MCTAKLQLCCSGGTELLILCKHVFMHYTGTKLRFKIALKHMDLKDGCIRDLLLEGL